MTIWVKATVLATYLSQVCGLIGTHVRCDMSGHRACTALLDSRAVSMTETVVPGALSLPWLVT